MSQDRLYSKTHEWVRIQPGPDGGKLAVVGLTAFAIEALTDLVYIDLPAVGQQVRAGEPFGEIESVKAVSDLYSPVDGRVVEVNSALAGNLQNLAADPYEAGWFVKIQIADEAGLGKLLDEDAYKKQCAEEPH